MTQMTEFLVKKDDFRECRVAEGDPPEPGPGQALLRVDTFGMTSNNVTYAVFGEAMSYWDFFPAEDGWGTLPTWGFAEVESSEAEGVEAGHPALRVPAVLLAPGGDAGRRRRVRVRRRLSRTKPPCPPPTTATWPAGADPFYRAETEAIQMLLRPLFFTSFLIDDQLDDDGLATRGPVIVSSASSKTSIAAAFLLAQREDVELVGLTSGRSVEFVEGLGIYDRTVSYDAIDSLERGPATYVDVSGDGDVRQAVHSHFGDDLVHSMAVGATHWEEMGAGAGELPGPAPAFFFAPDRVAKRAEDWGRAELETRVADAWHPFCEWIDGWLETIDGEGFDAVQDAWLDVLEGRVEPKQAHVLSL